MIDASGRRARLHRRHLAALAAAAVGDPVDDRDVHRQLTEAGALDATGRVTWPLAGLAAAAAGAEVAVDVARVRVDAVRAVEVRAGPDGVLVVPAQGTGEVALQPPDALARTLWRLLHLGPRAAPTTSAGPLDADRLVAPFRGGGAGWLTALGVAPARAVLDRADLRTAHGAGPAATLGALDDGARVWEVRPDPDGRLAVVPARPLRLFTGLAGWQTGLTDGPGPAPEDAAGRVTVEDATVAVPDGWERLPPPPGSALVARQAGGDRFRVNLTVAPDAGPSPDDPTAAVVALARELHGGVAVDALPDGTGVVVHSAPTGDVVSLQRRLPHGAGSLAVTYTCAVEQLPRWGEVLLRWLAAAG